MNDAPGPIGIFDSGYGGLTIFKDIKEKMPEYDYIYLGDNARTPYGTRSQETVYRYTYQAVSYLFEQGCRLVILACNTASAMALRSIQQNDLQYFNAHNRVLGVLRPTTEMIGDLTESGHIGICATEGTVSSKSYLIEAAKFAPDVHVFQQACPSWVTLIENNETESRAAEDLVERYMSQLLLQSSEIDSILLACTHYPLLFDKIRAYTPPHIKVVTQGEIVATKLLYYLKRHPELDDRCSKNAKAIFLTTGEAEKFDANGSRFFQSEIKSLEVAIF